MWQIGSQKVAGPAVSHFLFVSHFVWIMASKRLKTTALETKLETAATVKRLYGATWAYCSATEHNDCHVYSPQMSPWSAQISWHSTCWGNKMWKRLAVGTPGDCNHCCCCAPPRNGKLGSPRGSKQGTPDPGPEFGAHCSSTRFCAALLWVKDHFCHAKRMMVGSHRFFFALNGLTWRLRKRWTVF